MERIGWGILGTGKIAERFAEQLGESESGRLAGVASRAAARATAFAQRHDNGIGAVRAFGSYAELLDDPGIDAVYVATPHTEHLRLVVSAAEAGKHVLCEKPLAVNHAGVMLAVEAARRAGVYLAEGYMYRFHPQTERLVELVRSGAIGAVQHIEASFAVSIELPRQRLADPDLAGGAILDLGGYPVSMARLLAGAAVGEPFAEPVDFTAAGSVGETGVDEWATASLTFASGVTAHVTTGIKVADDNRVVVSGAGGRIVVSQPWLPDPEAGSTIDVFRVDGTHESIPVPGAAQYALEADAVAAFAGEGQAPAMGLADSLGNAAVLDRWRAALGLEYPFERATAHVATATGRALSPRPEHPMPTGRIPGIDRDISRLVMGCDNQRTLPHASAMFDDFVERGGNAFDTAYHYAGGLTERLLGQWITNRGIRDDVVIIGKGAHTPHCDPESITRQLFESLDRLQTDHVDIYFMHRDNPDVPVGEFVDVLNEHVEAGRIGAFGGSNWTTARIDEANAYSAVGGKRGFAAVSNHFGLAHALDVPWAGCEHVTDDASRRWFERNDMPLFPWSSQARGFFAGRAAPENHSDPELVRCFYSDDNFERLARARKHADRLGVAPTAIALAYVLAQRFPTFALIGPRSIDETRSSTDALTVELTPEQVDWLDLRDERP